MSFIGFVPIDQPLNFGVLTTSASQVPQDSSPLPLYRVYGNSGLLQVGALTVKESLPITNASNAPTIVITSPGHGLSTGQMVTISGVLGNTAANGVFSATVIDGDTFSIPRSGNAAYTSGGVWASTGYYQLSFTPTEGNGYAQGEYYDVLVVAVLSGVTVEYAYRLGVI